MDKNVYAAIALALFEYQGNNVHDRESGIITISTKCSPWGNRAFVMTKKPLKK